MNDISSRKNIYYLEKSSLAGCLNKLVEFCGVDSIIISGIET